MCSMSTFFKIFEFIDACPDDSAIGVVSATIIEQGNLGLIRLAVPLFDSPPRLGSQHALASSWVGRRS